jgi:hypothetical protein
VAAEAGCAGKAEDAADVGGAASSLSGDNDNDSGAPEVSGTSPVGDAFSAPGFTSSDDGDDGSCVRSIGLAGSGGTVGK